MEKKLELFLFQQIYYFYCCLILRRSLLNRPFSRHGRRSLPRVKKILLIDEDRIEYLIYIL